MLCLSDIVIMLRNYPRGENSRDVRVLNLMRMIVQTEFVNAVFDTVLVYNNLILPDNFMRQNTITSLEDAGHSSPETSDADENCQARQTSATVEDSDDLPRTSRIRRRRRRRRKQSEAAVQHPDSSSENDQPPPLENRRKHRRPVQNRDPELPCASRARRELAGRKRRYSKRWPKKENTTEANKDAVEETDLMNKNRKTHQRPGQDESPLSAEPVPGPSGKDAGLMKRQETHVPFKVKAPSKDSMASAKEPLAGRKKKKRPRKGDKYPAKQHSTSTTDSEEPQPRPLRKKKKKDKGKK